MIERVLICYPASGMGSGGIHEYAWNQNDLPRQREIPELIPTLSVVSDSTEIYPKSVRNIIQKANTWEQEYLGVSKQVDVETSIFQH